MNLQMAACHICRLSHIETALPDLKLVSSTSPLSGPSCSRCLQLVLKYHKENQLNASVLETDLYYLDERKLLGLRMRRSLEIDARVRSPLLCIPSPLRGQCDPSE